MAEGLQERLDSVYEECESTLNVDLVLDLGVKMDNNVEAIIAINKKIDQNTVLTKQLEERVEKLQGGGGKIGALEEKIEKNTKYLKEFNNTIENKTLKELEIIFGGTPVQGNELLYPIITVDSHGRVINAVEGSLPYNRTVLVRTFPESIGGKSATLYSKEFVEIIGTRVSCRGTAFFNYNIFDTDIDDSSNFADVFNVVRKQITGNTNLEVRLPLPVPVDTDNTLLATPAGLGTTIRFTGLGQDKFLNQSFSAIGTARMTASPFDSINFIEDLFDFDSLPLGQVLQIIQVALDVAALANNQIKSVMKNTRDDLGSIGVINPVELESIFIDKITSFDFIFGKIPGIVDELNDLFADIFNIYERMQSAINSIPGISGINFAPYFEKLTGVNPSGSVTELTNTFTNLIRDLNNIMRDLIEGFGELSQIPEIQTFMFDVPPDLDLYDFLLQILQLIKTLALTFIDYTSFISVSNEGYGVANLSNYLTDVINAIVDISDKELPVIQLPLFEVDYSYTYTAKLSDIEVLNNTPLSQRNNINVKL